MAPLRLWIWFGIASLLMLVALAVSPVRHVFPEWKTVQKAYNRLAGERYAMGQDVRPVEVGLRQTWNPRLGIVDRCTTCHLGMEQPALHDAPQPFRSHPSTPHRLGEIGCTVCHRGQGRATTTEAAHGAREHWESPMLPDYYVSGSCGSCHLGSNPPEAHILAQGRQIIERSSCVACHEIPGFARSGQAGPDLSAIGSKVRPEWLVKWLRQPFDYLPRSEMPDFHLSEQEAATLASFLLTFKDGELDALAGSRLERSLLDASYEEIEYGETRYRQLRCISCHPQEGRGGVLAPDLGKVGSKTKPIWLDAWLRDPRKFFSDTLMPQYGLSERDRRSVVSFLMAEFVDYDSDPEEDERIASSIPEPTDAVIAEGKRLYQSYGCGQCHELAGVETRGGFAAGLAGIGRKDIDQLDFGQVDIHRTLVDWLDTKMRTPRAYGEQLKMPDYRFSDEEARQVVAALLSLAGDSIPPEYLPASLDRPAFEANGPFKRIVEKYQCLTCHSIGGSGGTMAPDLAREGSIAKPDWIARYFKLPYTLRPIMTERMPELGMTDDEIKTAVNYFTLVLTDDSVPREAFKSAPDSETVEAGKRLFYEKYGCQSCHQVGGEGGYVGPPLDGLRDRLYSGFVYEWVLNPQRFIPGTIDPNQGLTQEEARAVTAFLYSLPALGGGTGGAD